MDKKLLCYAFGHGTQWEAICVDFDLAVNGSSFKDVQDRLGEMIRTYVEDAMKEDERTAARLLGRRAPLMLRLKLALKLLRNFLGNRNGKDDEYYAGYDVPCRA